MNILGMFAKYWEPGRVKTRLAEGVGQVHAAEVYRLFVATLLGRFATVGQQRQLVYAPNSRQLEMEQAAGEHWQVLPQAEGDLGQRMQTFFDQAFAAGASRVVLIGSDSPLLPLEYMEHAFEALDDHDLVLGPSHDGGYYLVGAATHTPPIFEGVAWSTSAVLSQTLERATSAGLRHKLLPTWYDIDQLTDLQHLNERLTETNAWPELLAAVRRALQAS